LAPETPCARFLVVFVSYTQPGEWITAGSLAARIVPNISAESLFAKEVSRKLSNLNRFGHLERRQTPKLVHEYMRKPEVPVRLPPELRAAAHIVLPDPSLDPKDNA
jgi:hypothetical protein